MFIWYKIDEYLYYFYLVNGLNNINGICYKSIVWRIWMLIRIMSKGYNFGCLIQRGILAITIISFYSISFFSSLYNKPIRFNFSFFVRCTFVFGLNRLFFGLCIVGKLYSTSIGCFLALIMLGPTYLTVWCAVILR